MFTLAGSSSCSWERGSSFVSTTRSWRDNFGTAIYATHRTVLIMRSAKPGWASSIEIQQALKSDILRDGNLPNCAPELAQEPSPGGAWNSQNHFESDDGSPRGHVWGFRRFVSSTTAPIATGRSDNCRVGLPLTGESRLSTAHHKSGYGETIGQNTFGTHASDFTNMTTVSLDAPEPSKGRGQTIGNCMGRSLPACTPGGLVKRKRRYKQSQVPSIGRVASVSGSDDSNLNSGAPFEQYLILN